MSLHQDKNDTGRRETSPDRKASSGCPGIINIKMEGGFCSPLAEMLLARS